LTVLMHPHDWVVEPASPHELVGQGVEEHWTEYDSHGHTGWTGAGVGTTQPDLTYGHRKPCLPPVVSTVVKTDLSSATALAGWFVRPRNRITAPQMLLSC